MHRVELIGGPFDGAERARPRSGPFVYVDEQLRCWKNSGPGRVLYRLLSGRMLFAEAAYVQCPGCSCFHSRRASHCQLCGCVLATSAQKARSG